MRLFSRKTSFRGFSFPNIVPMIVKNSEKDAKERRIQRLECKCSSDGEGEVSLFFVSCFWVVPGLMIRFEQKKRESLSLGSGLGGTPSRGTIHHHRRKQKSVDTKREQQRVEASSSRPDTLTQQSSVHHVVHEKCSSWIFVGKAASQSNENNLTGHCSSLCIVLDSNDAGRRRG